MNQSAEGRAARSASALPTELPPLSGHGCFLLYPIRVSGSTDLPELSLTLQQRLRDGGPATCWLPASEHAAVLAAERVTRLWEPAPLPEGADLHPHVRRMLGETQAGGDAHTLSLKLADLPLQLLQGKRLARHRPAEEDTGDRRRRLELHFNAAARERIRARTEAAAQSAVEVCIQEIRLVVFRTRFGIVLVELAFRPSDRAALGAVALVEAVHSVARFNRLQWRDAALPPFTLGDVVRSLHASADVSGRGRRAFTATYAQFSQAAAPDATRRFAIQLARHYTDQYRLADDPSGIRFVADFANVLHAVALEGSATVVDLVPPAGHPIPPFLRDFETVTFKCHYLPITLLGLHEFVTLLHLTNDSSFWPELDPDDPFRHWLAQARSRSGESLRSRPADARAEARARLERLRDEVLRFRLGYRMSHISYVTMHNAVYAALREAWSLDRMLQEVSRDTAEISAFLEQAIAKDAARQVRAFGVVGAAGLSLVAALGLFDKLSSLLPAEGTFAGIAFGRSEFEALVFFPLAVIVAVIAGWVTWQKTRHAHAFRHDDDLTGQVIEAESAEPTMRRNASAACSRATADDAGNPSP